MMRFDTTLSGNTILLDIDGTLTPAGSALISEETVRAVGELARHNEVFLFSNRRMPARNQAVAELLGLPLIVSSYRKPSLRVLESISREKPLVVIGDKVMTDGLLAWRAGGEFVRVPRITAPDELFLDRLYSMIDDSAAYVFTFMNYLFRSATLRFITSGALAGGIQLSVLYVLVDIFGMWYVAGATISFVITLIVSFLLQKMWTFRRSLTEGVHRQATLYLLLSLFNLPLNTLLVYYFTEAGSWYLLSQTIAILVIAIESFFVYKYVIFRS